MVILFTEYVSLITDSYDAAVESLVMNESPRLKETEGGSSEIKKPVIRNVTILKKASQPSVPIKNVNFKRKSLQEIGDLPQQNFQMYIGCEYFKMYTGR